MLFESHRTSRLHRAIWATQGWTFLLLKNMMMNHSQNGKDCGSVELGEGILGPVSKKCLKQVRAPPKGGRNTGAALENFREKKCRTSFDAFCRDFGRFFALREKCRKVSKIFLRLVDDFRQFFDVAPFCWPLLRSAGKAKLRK